jgi:hypothetical protein
VDARTSITVQYAIMIYRNIPLTRLLIEDLLQFRC